MSDTAPGPTSDGLMQLLTDWIETDTWDESQVILRANADRLLSDEALAALDELLAENAEDEDATRILLKHKTILETARAGSIDAAYAELLEEPPLEVALKALPHELRDALQAMIAVESPAELLEQTRQYPILLTTQAATAIDTLLDELRQANQEDTVDFINARYDTLKRISESARDPLNVAINALLQADNPYELQQAIAQHPLLLGDAAMKALEEIITRTEQNGDAVLAQRLRFRLDEVRRIRKQREQAARNGRPALVNEDLERGYVEISAERNSIAVGRSEGSITQTNINIENLTLPPKKWQTPKRQSLPKAFVGREKELQDVHDYLVAGEAVAIIGRATATMLQGMAGIGKTYLAVKLSMDLQAHFPGGVIRVNLGPEVTSEERAQVKLRELADYAFEGNLLQVAGQLQPEQVAAWLQEMAPGRLLVIFDDVWRQEPLLFLERSLPADAVRVVTTRDANIAQALAGKKISLDRMTDEDGVALLEDRLGCEGNAAYRADLEALVRLLGGHALALDIAAARIKNPRRIQAILDDLKKGVGQATLDRLKLPRGETRETNLEKSLALSYEQMTDEEKSRFRALGVFAVETPITVEAVTAIWGMEELADAQNALYDLVDLALLEEFEDAMGISYRQHNLLHVYAYALLDKEGELNSASWAHAEYYKSMALRAETATPKDYALLDRHLQDLQAALRWADKYEPRLFAQLVEVLSQFLQLRGQFELLEVYLPRAIAAATATEDKGRQANVLRSLGDLEERLGNLDQARAHYDAALPLYQAERARLGEANVYMSFADMFLAQKEWTQAKIHYEQALPLYVTERDPLGQANTLIDLGRARFELGEHEQGLQDVQHAAELYHAIQDKEWARRAERYLAEMRARLGLSVSGNEHSLFQDNELVQAFIGVESVQAMLQLVQQHPELLTDEWFTVVEGLIAAQTEESAKQALRERLDTLKQFRHDIELQGAINSEIVSLLDEFARADWPKRRQLLMEHADILLSENIEPVFDELLKVSTDPDVIEALGHLRTLLRRCRTWGIEPTEYFESGMRLGDSIEIPSEYELDVLHIATLLSGQRDDPSAHERAIEAMQALVNGLPPATPELFRGALLRDLADTMGVLLEKHPRRKLEQMEAYYREALPLYQAADRPISVAYIQRSLGDVLSEQGRYNEALAPLQAASLGLQTHEHTRDNAAWAFSSYGSVLDNLGQIEEALAAYTEAMKLLPESAPLLRNRAETLIHARRLEEAEADLARAVGLDGNEDSPYLWYHRAQIGVARGEGSLVDQMLDEVMKRDASFDVAFLRVQGAWLRGDIRAALEGLQNALEKANEGDRASMRREMERLFAEHLELDGRDELQDILMKFVV